MKKEIKYPIQYGVRAKYYWLLRHLLDFHPSMKWERETLGDNETSRSHNGTREFSPS